MMLGLQMFNEMEMLNREMDQLLSGLGFSVVPDKRFNDSVFKVRDKGEAYQVDAALPGLDIEKLDIDVLGRQLSLSAERAASDVADEAVWHRRERRSGVFQRSLTLPEEINAEKVEAEYKNGNLTITLPKAASVLPRKISVKAA